MGILKEFKSIWRRKSKNEIKNSLILKIRVKYVFVP